MMPEEMMRLFQQQMDAWMKLMNPTEAMKSTAEMQKVWESFFRQQLELFQSSTESARKQFEQMMRPFQQQLEATQIMTQETQRMMRWFTEEAGAMFKTMRDYYTTLADIEERLAKLHRLAAEQIEHMEGGAPRAEKEKKG